MSESTAANIVEDELVKCRVAAVYQTGPRDAGVVRGREAHAHVAREDAHPAVWVAHALRCPEKALFFDLRRMLYLAGMYGVCR